MIAKPLDQISKEDIERLIADEVHEGRRIDYKSQLPDNSDRGKKEFLADASSFANASGGDLLFGIVENKGVPTSAPGLPGINTDAETLRLENIIRTGVEPRIPAIQIRTISGFSQGPVLLLRVPKSWASPHMVTYKKTSRFFSRTNAGKFPMDVTEIRSAFALSEALPERMRRFRDDRLAKVVADETPVRLAPNPKMVLHLLPLSAFSIGSYLDPAELRNRTHKLQTIRGGGRARYNVDGLITVSIQDNALSTGYCQVFRTGIIESVDVGELPGRGECKWIPSEVYEQNIIRSVIQYRSALRDMQVPLPIAVMLNLVGFAGYEMPGGEMRMKFDSTPIDRDMLILPDVLLEDCDVDVPEMLRPIFDAVWNAAGWERSMNYDDHGRWTKAKFWS